jgi:hypothetical protein
MTKRPGLAARSSSIAAAMTAASATAMEEAPAPAPVAAVIEKVKPIGLTLRLEPPLHDQLRKIAFDERTSIHSLLLEAVEHVIKTRAA